MTTDVEAAVRAAQQEAHRAAVKAEGAQQRLSAAREAAQAVRSAKVREWAEETVASFPQAREASLKAIAERREEFLRLAVTDLVAAVPAYLRWFEARAEARALRLKVSAALSELGQQSQLGDQPPEFVPSYAPSLVEALNAAASQATNALHREATEAAYAEIDELRDGA